jgi:catalase-peroxidase
MGPRSRYLGAEIPFVNLLDMSTTWKATAEDADVFEGRDRATGELRWTGTRFDLARS